MEVALAAFQREARPGRSAAFQEQLPPFRPACSPRARSQQLANSPSAVRKARCPFIGVTCAAAVTQPELLATKHAPHQDTDRYTACSEQSLTLGCAVCRYRAVFRYPVLLQVSKPVLNMLQRVEPYVAFGYPNLKSVRELIYKRGYAKVG